MVVMTTQDESARDAAPLPCPDCLDAGHSAVEPLAFSLGPDEFAATVECTDDGHVARWLQSRRERSVWAPCPREDVLAAVLEEASRVERNTLGMMGCGTYRVTP